jgi:hypothetical protein
MRHREIATTLSERKNVRQIRCVAVVAVWTYDKIKNDTQKLAWCVRCQKVVRGERLLRLQ